MLNWQFSELIKEPKQFHESIDCKIVVENRFDILSINSCQVDGEITFDGAKGKLNLDVTLCADVLAANTGEPVVFTDTLTLVEDFDKTTEEYVDQDARKVDLLSYIYAIVDVMIPLYVNDESKQLTKTSDKHWELIDEATFLKRLEETPTESALSNLSELLSRKSK